MISIKSLTKMTKSFFLFFTIFQLSLLSNTYAQEGLNQLDQDQKKHGKWVKKHAGGEEIEFEGVFEHGVPVGVFKRYSTKGKIESILNYRDHGQIAFVEHFHPNGKILARGKYQTQEKDSVWNFYSDEGQLIRSANFKRGKLVGIEKKFYRNGNLKELAFYNQESVLDSIHEEYYENGNPMSVQNLVNGKPEGAFKIYYNNKVYRTIGNYKNGRKHGSWKYYSPRLKLEKEEKYNDGELIFSSEDILTYWDDSTKVIRTKEKYERGGRSSLVAYHPNGKIAREGYYYEGKKDSTWQYFDENGNLESIKTFYRGMKNGQWTYYYPDQVTRKEEAWFKDKRTSEFKEFYPNGTLKVNGHFENGVETKEWIFYDENGRVLKRENKS